MDNVKFTDMKACVLIIASSLIVFTGGLTPEQVQSKIERLGKRTKQIIYEDPQDLEKQANGDLDNEDQEPTSEDSLLSFGGGGGVDVDGNELDEAGASASKIKCRACDPPHCEVEYVCIDAAIVSL